jgi:hypothetical protein
LKGEAISPQVFLHGWTGWQGFERWARQPSDRFRRT